jgi:hypothetical protein
MQERVKVVEWIGKLAAIRCDAGVRLKERLAKATKGFRPRFSRSNSVVVKALTRTAGPFATRSIDAEAPCSARLSNRSFKTLTTAFPKWSLLSLGSSAGKMSVPDVEKRAWRRMRQQFSVH